VGSLREQAERLRELHRGPRPRVLPNAWDVASAVAFATLRGCEAIATSSAAVAASLGYPDGEVVPAEEMLGVVARIAAAVDVPVTADLEAGYGDPVATARASLEAGAVGMNLEDSRHGRLIAVEDQVEEIRAVREAAAPLVLNARTDVFLHGDGGVEEAVERANAYLDAGADCAFTIGVTDGPTIARLAAGIRGPLNVLATPQSPPLAELARMGVARVSVGSQPMRVALAAAVRAARELLEQGTYGALEDVVPSAELARLLRS